LSIPYLEKKEKKIGRESQGPKDVQAQKGLEKDIENISLYSIGFLGTDQGQVSQSDPVLQLAGQLGKNENKISGSKNNVRALNEFRDYQKLPGENIGRSSDNELPWIFKIILGIIRFVYTHKLEIFLWSVVVIMSFLIGILVVKK